MRADRLAGGLAGSCRNVVNGAGKRTNGAEKRTNGAEKRTNGAEKRTNGAEKRTNGAEKRKCTLWPPYTTLLWRPA